MFSQPGRLIVVIFVVVSYFYWASISPLPAKVSKYADGYYQLLGDSFLSGHVNVPVNPPSYFFKLPNPYDPNQNSKARGWCLYNGTNYTCSYLLHDLSFYKNKFYLYFGPLPVIAFYIPFKLLTNYYPSDTVGVLFFLSIGFIFQFALMIKIRNTFFSWLPESWLLLAGIVLGIANNSSFLLVRSVFYEVAISGAFCSISIAIYFLFNILTLNARVKDVLLFSLFLSFAVASRAHFSLVCFLMTVLLSFYFVKKISSKRWPSIFLALFIPPVCVGFLLALYNVERYGSIFEFGQSYQLSSVMLSKSLFNISNIFQNIKTGIYSYFFRPYFVSYSDRGYSLIKIPDKYILDHLAGVLSTAPILLFFLSLPRLVYQQLKNNSEKVPLLYFLMLLSVIPIFLIGFLCCLSGATQRYVTDFIPYLLILSIVSFWIMASNEKNIMMPRLPKMLFVGLAAISIFVCFRHGLYVQVLAI